MMLSISESFMTFSISHDCVIITMTYVTGVTHDITSYLHLSLKSRTRKEKKLKNKIMRNEKRKVE